MCRVLSESVVWLYANNRVAEAEEIIRNAAKLNNITLPDKILVRPDIAMTVEIKNNGEKPVTEDVDDEKVEDDDKTRGGNFLVKLRNLNDSKKSKETQDTGARYTMLDIFRNRHLTINTVCMAFLWSVPVHYH